MGFLDKVGSFLKREAEDLGDAAENVKGKLDDELTKREQELTMSPSEKIAALQQQAASTDARFDALANKALDRDAMADAVAEVQASDANLPNVTHIVLPDGRVKSGHDQPAPVVDDDGNLREVPVVAAPTAEDLQKFEEPPEANVTVEPPEASVTVEPTESEVDPVVEDLPAPPAPVEAVAEDLPAPPAPPAPVEDAVEDLPAPPAPVEDAAEDLPAPPVPAPAEVASTEPTDEDLPAPPAPESSGTDLEVVPVADVPALLEGADFGKTPAQLKYERARAAANDLLDELRGELKDEGEI